MEFTKDDVLKWEMLVSRHKQIMESVSTSSIIVVNFKTGQVVDKSDLDKNGDIKNKDLKRLDKVA